MTLFSPVYIFIISCSFLIRTINVTDRSFIDNQIIHFVFSNYFFENRAVYKIMWKNILEQDRLQMTIQYGACPFHTG